MSKRIARVLERIALFISVIVDGFKEARHGLPFRD